MHQPIKTGQTMSYYDDGHLRKLMLIRELKGKGLPLIAVRQQLVELESDQPEIFRTRISTGVRQPLPKVSGSGLPVREKSRRMRERILETGCRFFQENGYKATRISDVTKTLKIGKGTFYFYFSNKQELLLECVPRIFDELFSSVWGRIRQAKNPRKRLEQRAYGVLPVLREFCAIIQLSKEAMEDPDVKLQQLGRQTYLSVRLPLETDIKRGIQQGVFQPVDPKLTATLMIGMIENLYYMTTMEEGLDLSGTWDEIFDLITRGIERTD